MNTEHRKDFMFVCTHAADATAINRRIPTSENTDSDGYTIALCESCHERCDAERGMHEVHTVENIRAICRKCYRGEIH